ncbi:MAG: ABC transporter ATP-binding protein [Acidimicrobiales bacterium]|nr:ABC transporter ATP-binding protein [Acidimicrobiales bacterium]
MIAVEGLAVDYGPVRAVRDLSFEIRDGEVLAILGRNGAGKTTTMKALAGLLPAAEGRMSDGDVDITRAGADERVSRGIVLVPEGRGMFADLSVRENLLMGAYARRKSSRALREDLDRVTAPFPRLRERMAQRSGSLSGGEQQMLAVARGLMAEPKVLMIDEPSLGLAPVIVDQLYEFLGSIRDQGMTLVIVEQYVRVALGIADRAYVLDKGEIALEGDAATLRDSPELIDTYLANNAA